MLRFIWQNWWRHKERFILLLVGALIVSSGLSYLIGLSQTNKGTIVNALQKRWSASYDILVRPPGSRSVTEENSLLEPDYLSGLSGGISLEQYHKIQQIDGIAVAAPIAMIGYLPYSAVFKEITPLKKGIYRLTKKRVMDTGPRNIVVSNHRYFIKGIDLKHGPLVSYQFHGDLSGYSIALLAGIDPEAEAKLVGLHDAVLDVGESRYFRKDDPVTVSDEYAGGRYTFPVLVSNRNYVDETYSYTVERLELPLNENTISKLVDGVDYQNFTYLDPVQVVDDSEKTYTYTSKQLFNLFVSDVTGIDPKTGKKVNTEEVVRHKYYLGSKPSPLNLRPVRSPFPERWPYAYEVNTYHLPDSVTEKARSNNNPNIANDPTEFFRRVKLFSDVAVEYPDVITNFIGIYDPKKLDISKDPLTELPMETYRPASAKFVLDAKGEPVNPPVKMKPADKAFGLLTKPPSLLTTIEAAAAILGDKPISSIRIKVAGVSDLSESSQQKLEHIATKIEEETGLITDITLGSSPQPALTHVPAVADLPELGWIQQPWVKLGSSFAIFKETRIGLSGVIGSVILVAIVYVFASLLVSLLARRKEFAVLLAVGWRPKQLSKMIFLEALLLGSFVAVVAWTILGLVLSIHQTETSLVRILLTGLFGLVIYGLGAVIPSMLATRISPYEALHTGEISKGSRRFLRTRTLFSMAFNHLIGKWRRSFLSIVAIAVPTGLLAFFLFVTFRLKGVMYTTWLGQYVALEVGPTHYVAMAVALLIAVLTTAEVMWQNVSERQPEIALLKSIGWRNRNVRLLVLLEGGLSGLLAGIVGLLIAFGIIWGMYRQIPYEHIGFLLATGIIPIVTGFIGALLPSERAVRILPSQGVRGQYANQKKSERQLRIGLGTVAAVLIAGFLSMIFQIVPVATESSETATKAVTQDAEPTTGEITTGVEKNDTKPKEMTNDSGKKPEEEVKPSDEDLPPGVPDVSAIINVGEELRFPKIAGKKLPPNPNIFSAKLVNPPAKADLGKPEEGMKYVSIQLTFEYNNTSSRSIIVQYQPYYFYLYTNQAKKEDVDFTIIKKVDYEKARGRLGGKGSLTSVVTYEVKKDAKNLTLVVNTGYSPPSFHTGRIAVRINKMD